jgi:hypothetical protein
MTNYELIENEKGKCVKRTLQNGEVSYIPTDPANSDYQRYLRWVENPNAEVEHLTEIVPANE